MMKPAVGHGSGDGNVHAPRTTHDEPRTTVSEHVHGAEKQKVVLFDFERLAVYGVATSFKDFADQVCRKLGAYHKDQLARASGSVVQNICEGSGKRTWPDKRRYYESARASAMECASIVEDVGRAHLITVEEHQLARGLLLRAVQMLTKLSRLKKWRDLG